MAQKIFTRDEADRMLPLVSNIVRDIRNNYRAYTDTRKALAQLQRRHMLDPDPAVESQIEELEGELKDFSAELKGFIRELTDLHVLIKDPIDGIVDFPAEMNGGEAFLCWKYGERSVEHWHGVEEGFADRRKVRPVRSRTA